MMLEELGHKTVCVAESASEAKQMYLALKPDFLIIDIQIEGEESGIDLAEYINTKGNTPFVFLSALIENEVFVQASKTIPEAYLIKPPQKDALSATLNIVVSKIALNKNKQSLLLKTKNEQFIFIKVGNFFKKVPTEEIVYVSYTEDKYAQLNLQSIDFQVKLSLTEIENMMPDYFIRIHKSYLINKNFINSFKSDFSQVVLINDIKLNIGRTYKQNIEKNFINFYN